MQQFARLSTCLLVPIAFGCALPTAPPDAAGMWGGSEASLVLARSGGTVSYLCGAGTIDSTWAIGADGRFRASGQHFFGGGPVPPEGHPPHPAQYEGTVTGVQLVFTVTLTDLSQTLGPFHLVRGGPAVTEICV